MNLETFKQLHLNTILDSYLGTLIWQGHNWANQDEYGNPSSLDHFDSSAFDEAALDSAREDVEGFIDQAFKTLGEEAFEGLEPSLIGHNFALSRNGHGAGFIDLGAKHAEALHKAARAWGEVDLYVYERDGEEWLGIS